MNLSVLSNSSSGVIVVQPFNCSDGNAAIWYAFNECVYDTKGAIAITFGILSIISWMVYALPQMIMNCRKGLQDEAISPWLLIFWTVGDTTNLVGAILTKQLMLQKIVAGYSICCDLILISQYIFAVLKHKWKVLEKGPQEVFYEDNPNYVDSVSVRTTGDGLLQPTKKVSPAVKSGGVTLFCLSLFLFVNFVSVPSQSESKFTGRTILSLKQTENPPILTTNMEIVGYVLGWFSTIFYCSGRLPQIYKNFTRKCTDGLSFGLFLFALIGNGTYGAQIVVTSIERVFIYRHLPWIIGSWGVMVLDLTILIQCYIYRRNPPHPYEILSSIVTDPDDQEEGPLSISSIQMQS